MELLTSMKGKIIMIILGGVALAMLCFLCTTELRLREVESKTKSYFDELKNESRKLTDALGIHKLYHQDRHVYITQDKESHPPWRKLVYLELGRPSRNHLYMSSERMLWPKKI